MENDFLIRTFNKSTVLALLLFLLCIYIFIHTHMNIYIYVTVLFGRRYNMWETWSYFVDQISLKLAVILSASLSRMYPTYNALF